MARRRKNRDASNASYNIDNVSTVRGQKTVAELKNFYNSNVDRIMRFDKANDAPFKLMTDITKTTDKRITAFNKETLMGYLKNIGASEKQLRNLSWYLYYRSQIYRKLINYNGTMFELDARQIIPQYEASEETQDDEKILKNFAETAQFVDSLRLQSEFLKVFLTCFIQDVYYGCAYYDDTGFYLMTLDPDYCKIAGQYPTGDFAFAFDLSYFNGKNAYLLEYWGEPFESMYKQYQKDAQNYRWQIFPEEYTACFKQNVEDWRICIPFYVGLFNELINLEDVKDVQAIADEQDIYKLIWLELETITGSKNIDDWKVDPELVIKYFNRMCEEALPPYVSAAIVPSKLNTIGFDSNDTPTNVNKVSNATKNVLNSGMGGQVLNSISITGTTGLKLAMKVDTELAISSLLGQVQCWVNRFSTYHVSDPCKVIFFPISAYTKEDFRKEILENATYGLPTKMILNTLSGISEYQTLAQNYFEENILNLSERFSSPLVSSHTTSGSDTGGRPQSDDSDLTEDGEQSREKSDRSNG